MASSEGDVTPDKLKKELDTMMDEVASRATSRVFAACQGIYVVRARSKRHLLLGRGATQSLCACKVKASRETLVATITGKALLKTVCKKCWNRYRLLFDKAMKIEIARLKP